MSLLGFQTAIAALIRCPDDNRGEDVAAFLKPYELDAREYGLVLQLAQHTELNKYGREQAGGRWELITRNIVRLFRFVDEELIEDLWYYHFEPKAMTVASDHAGHYDYSLAFMHFLRHDPEARAELAKVGLPYLDALLDFETAEIELRCPLAAPLPLHGDSFVANPYFRVLRLSYDIPAIIRLGEVAEEKLAEPKAFVFIRQGARRDPKVFEITGELGYFLLAQAATNTVAGSPSLGAAASPSAEVREALGRLGLLTLPS